VAVPEGRRAPLLLQVVEQAGADGGPEVAAARPVLAGLGSLVAAVAEAPRCAPARRQRPTAAPGLPSRWQAAAVVLVQPALVRTTAAAADRVAALQLQAEKPVQVAQVRRALRPASCTRQTVPSARVGAAAVVVVDETPAAAAAVVVQAVREQSGAAEAPRVRRVRTVRVRPGPRVVPEPPRAVHPRTARVRPPVGPCPQAQGEQVGPAQTMPTAAVPTRLTAEVVAVEVTPVGEAEPATIRATTSAAACHPPAAVAALSGRTTRT